MSSALNYRLPEAWQLTPLEKIIATGTRITYGVVQPGDEVANGVPFVRGGDIYDGRIMEQNLRTIAPEISHTSAHTVLKGGELLMSLVGYPGEVALVPASLAGANIARQVAYIKLGPKVDARYVMYYLQSDLGKYFLAQKFTGSAQQVINLIDLKNLNIITATLQEQKKIATILSTVDELIDTVRHKIVKLKNLKIGMMQERLTGAGGHAKLKNSPIGSVPKDWQLTTLREVAENLQTGPFGSELYSHEYVASGVPVVMPRDMKDQLIHTAAIVRISQEKADSLARYQLSNGDILFSRRGDIGRSALVLPENAGWICGTGCIKVTLDARVMPQFFIHYLTVSGVVDWLKNNAVGQTMLNLNTTILADLPVAIPPLREQHAIAHGMQSIDKVLVANEAKLQQLQRSKTALLQDLITGKVLTNIS